MRGRVTSPPPHSALNKKQDFYHKLNPNLLNMLNSEPKQANPIVALKWKELRPLNIYEIESKNPGSFMIEKSLKLVSIFFFRVQSI